MQCSQCGADFIYFPGEEEVYARFQVPLSTICPDCRQWRRMAFRNEKKLFRKKSVLSGKSVISLLPDDSPFEIVDQDEWWSDEFDATQYARDFDFDRPFFEQFRELQLTVPRWARIVVNCINSDYSNNCAEVKNGYLSFSSYKSEDVYYCVRCFRLTMCVDCMNVSDSEFCSMSMDCKKCYNVHYSQLAESCSDSLFLFDCRNCRDCILCSNQRNKQYMVRNKQLTKEEYEKVERDFGKMQGEFDQMIRGAIYRDMRIINSESSFGDFIKDSNNIVNGYEIFESEDCVNCYNCHNIKDCYDNLANDQSELCMDCDTSYELYNCKFCSYVGNSSNVTYCDQCFHLEDSFGCVGLLKHKNMILNKKYSEQEYRDMMVKIEEHMKKTGEWGKPFPANLSSFAYNMTVAYDLHPMSREDALARGFLWHDVEEKFKGEEFVTLPSYDSAELDESVCEKVLKCDESSEGYKVIPQELKFYKRFGLPVPRISPDERYKKFLSMQFRKKVKDSSCSKCGVSIKTTCPGGLKVMCEKCYEGELY